MKLGSRVTVAIAVVLATLGAASGTACACSCVELTDAEAARAAQAIFVGTLREVRGPTVKLSSLDDSRFLFEVDAVFKGEVYSTQSIVSASDGASCGLELRVGERALVFAHGRSDGSLEPGEFAAGLCGGTRRFGAIGLPSGLGEEAAPLPGSSPIGEDDSLPSVLVRNWYWLAAGLAALVGGIVMVRSRGSHRRSDA